MYQAMERREPYFQLMSKLGYLRVLKHLGEKRCSIKLVADSVTNSH